MGFPANDGKQSNQLSGNLGCQNLVPCPRCGQQRKHLGNWNVQLWEMYRKTEQEAERPDPGKCPYESPPRREGKNSQDKSAAKYIKSTNEGLKKLTAVKERELNLEVVSTYRYPHLVEPAWKFCGEPLHDSQGVITHMFKHIRAECRKWDLEQPFIAKVLAVQVEVEAMLKTLTLSSNNGQLVLALLHRVSNALGHKVDKKIEEAQ